jgi:hypothetical protein
MEREKMKPGFLLFTILAVLGVAGAACGPTSTPDRVGKVTATIEQSLTQTVTTLSSEDPSTMNLAWPGQQGDPAHTGVLDQELPAAFEPKWLSSTFIGSEDYQADWRVVADEDTVIVAGSAAPLYLGVQGLMNSYDRPSSSLLQTFGVTNGETLWSYDTGGVLIGSPQLYQERVFAVTRQPKSAGEEAFASVLHCLRSDNGSVQWRLVLPKTQAGALTVQDGVLVLLAGAVEIEDGELAVPWNVDFPIHALGLDAMEGTILWDVPLLEQFRFSLDPPTLADGRAFVTDGSHLYALELLSGVQLWTLDSEGDQNDSDMGFTGDLVATQEMLFASAWYRVPDESIFLNRIYALDPASGGIAWQHDLPETQTYDKRYRMSTHAGRLFTWGEWLESEQQVSGLMALRTEDGTEDWHVALDTGLPHPVVIGNNGRVLVSTYGRCWLLDEASGQILWAGEGKRVSELGISTANDWSSTFTYGRVYPNPPRVEWLPDEWAQDPANVSVLLAGFNTWLSAPAFSGGYVIGLTRFNPGLGPEFSGMRLVAWGADRTTPDARIRDIGLVRRNLQLAEIFGTAYDYNLVEWSLELGQGNPPTTWEVLYQDTLSTQTHLANLSAQGNPRRLGDGNWTLRLVVKDLAGLTGMDEWSFTNDYTPPSVSITAPTDGASIPSAYFVLTGTAWDTNGVSEVRVTADNGTTFTVVADGNGPWTLPIPVTSSMEGKSFTYYAEAVDTFGNVGRSNSVALEFPSFQVALQAAGRRLVSARSMFIDPAMDIDGDGIEQRLENAIIQMTTPIVELDEDENWLDQVRGGPNYPVVYFARVSGYTPKIYENLANYPPYILAYIVFGWSKDWGVAELGMTDVLLEAHRGDPENVIMAWRVTSETSAELEWVRTSSHSSVTRHHGLWSPWNRTCNLANIALLPGTVWGTQILCSELEFTPEDRLLLYPGEDKHAIYPNADMCNKEVTLIAGGVGEHCGWDPVTIDGRLVPGEWKESDFNQDPRYLGGGRWLFNAYNAGEPDPCHQYQLIDFLDQPATWRGLTDTQVRALTGVFPNEAIWSGTAGKRAEWDPENACTLVPGNGGGYDFCGGLEDTVSEPERCANKIGVPLGQAGDWTDDGPPDLMTYALNSRYRVTFSTGSREGAGTDARIMMHLNKGNLVGTAGLVLSGTESDVEAPFDRVGSFEQGDIDSIFWDLENQTEGEVKGISLQIYNEGDNPNWFVEQVVVQDLVSGLVWAGWPQVWVSTSGSGWGNEVDIPLSPYQPGSLALIPYQVSVITADASGAGTDADVSITLKTADARSAGPFNLDRTGADDFARASIDQFSIWAPDFGELGSLVVSLSNGEGDAAWYCQEVTLRNTITGQVWVFPVESWLGGGKPLSVQSSPND